MKKVKKGYRILLAVVVFATCSIVGLLFVPHLVNGEAIVDESAYYRVIDILDGDTFKVQIGWKKATVRMLGIDTPETIDPRKKEQCFGKEASRESTKLLTGKKVQLKLSPHREVRDKYRRILAYVYLEDATLVNRYLLANGFAREYTFGTPYSMRDDFVATQNEAKQRGVGLWGECLGGPTSQ